MLWHICWAWGCFSSAEVKVPTRVSITILIISNRTIPADEGTGWDKWKHPTAIHFSPPSVMPSSGGKTKLSAALKNGMTIKFCRKFWMSKDTEKNEPKSKAKLSLNKPEKIYDIPIKQIFVGSMWSSTRKNNWTYCYQLINFKFRRT